jgi:hypothetical protein
MCLLVRTRFPMVARTHEQTHTLARCGPHYSLGAHKTCPSPALAADIWHLHALTKSIRESDILTVIKERFTSITVHSEVCF